MFQDSESVSDLCMFFLFFIIFWVSTTSLYFVSSVLEYTVLIGLTLNVDILTPSLAFLFVLTTNLYLCYAKLQSKYKPVKKMISEKMQELQLNSDVPKNTIRAEMFWFVSDKVLPIKSEISGMVCNMIVVTGFLVLALLSIIVFGNKYFDFDHHDLCVFHWFNSIIVFQSADFE